MNNKKTVIGIIVTFYFMVIAGCNLYSFGVDNAPYNITGKVICEADNNEYEKGGFSCIFENFSEKSVKDFFVTFFLFDSDGEPMQQIAIHIDANIPPNKKEEFNINIDEVLPEKLNKKCTIDFLYASKIIYDDGSEWDDPMGLRYLF